jgi:hypothetical protein
MADSTIQEYILEELRGMRADNVNMRTEFNKALLDLVERTARLETDNHSLMGNGNPGRIAVMEKAIGILKGWRWYVVGITVGAGGVAGMAVTIIFKR